MPDAQPPPPRPSKVLRTGIALVLLVVSFGAALALAVTFSWPTGSQVEAPPLHWVSAGPEEEFPLWQPVSQRVEDPAAGVEHDFHIVRLPDEMLALSVRDPHLGCTVPWRPEFAFLGRTGWFRNPCHGQTYDLTGRCFSGPCVRGLDRFPVRLRDGTVQVDVSETIIGPSAEFRDEPLTPPKNPLGGRG